MTSWTTTAPTTPGWYWWRPEDQSLTPTLCWVSQDGVALFVAFAPATVRAMGGEFQGPIEPKE